MSQASAFFVLTVYLLAVYGLSNAIAVLKFGQPIRKVCKPVPVIGALLCCPACIAFWIGMGISVLFFSPAAPLVDVWWKAMFIDGLASSGVVWLLHVTAERLGFGVVD